MKKYLSLLKILLIGLVLSMGFQYIFAVSRPSVAPSSNPTVIDSGNRNNIIAGKLKIGGEWITDTSDPNYDLEQDYDVVVPDSDLQGSGLRLYSYSMGGLFSGIYVGGHLVIMGDTKFTGLSGTGSNLCISTDGELKKC